MIFDKADHWRCLPSFSCIGGQGTEPYE